MDKKRPTRKILRPDSVRGESPRQYDHYGSSVDELAKAVAVDLREGDLCSPKQILAALEPDVNCSLMSPLEECCTAAGALIRQFSSELSPSKARQRLGVFNEAELAWFASNTKALLRKMASAPEPLVVLCSKTAVGEDDIIDFMEAVMWQGRVPSFLRDRKIMVVDVDYGDPDLAVFDDSGTDGGLCDYRTPEGAYRLWACMYSCFDDGKTVLLFREPTGLVTLASIKPMMQPCVVMAKTDVEDARAADSYTFLLSDDDVFYSLEPNKSADLNARFLSRKITASSFWMDRYGWKITPGVVLVMCRAATRWCSIEDYDPKSIVDLIIDYCADCSFCGSRPSPKNAREWLSDRYGISERELMEPASFRDEEQFEADLETGKAGAMTSRDAAMKMHPSTADSSGSGDGDVDISDVPSPPRASVQPEAPHGGETTTGGKPPLFKFSTRTELVERLKSRVIGQDESLEQVVKPLVRWRAGLSNERKPIASLLLAGPSGVGKTETARAIAEICFGSEDCMKRIDCSELHDPISVNRLIGSAQGYVGYDNGGDLLNWVYKHKRGVLLMDEIEKADPSIYDSILLPLLDYGKLSGATRCAEETTAQDGSKRRAQKTKVMDVDCTQLVVIMTSNLGAQSISERGVTKMGFGNAGDAASTLEADVKSALEKEFRTELRNRIGKVVIYQPLSVESLEKIFELKWKAVSSKAKLHGLDVDLSPEVPGWFVKRAKADNYGARPLDRMIEDRLSDPLADIILDGEDSSAESHGDAAASAGATAAAQEAGDGLAGLPESMRRVVASGGAETKGSKPAGFPRMVNKRIHVEVGVSGDDLDISIVG